MSRLLPVWFEHAAVLTAFTFLAFVITFPHITGFADHIPGVSGDVWSYLWALGWARVSLLNLVVNPFHTDYIFYPLGGATQLLWGTALPSFASIPLQLAFGLVPAFNLVFLAASALTGYGTYLLAQEVFRGLGTGVKLAAFVSAVAFTFCALRLGYGLAFTNLFHTEFIPFYVLMLLRTTRRRSWNDGVLGGFFFALNVYIDFQIAAFLAVLTGLWLLYLVGKWLRLDANYGTFYPDSFFARSTTLLRGQMPIVMLIFVAGALSLPMLGLVLNDFSIEGGDYIQVYPLRYSAARSYDLLSYVLPNARSTLYQILPTPHVEGVNASITTPDNSELSPDEQAFLGITVLILAVTGIVRFRAMFAFWILAALVFALLSLGPVLHIAGKELSIPLPFILANNIPIINHIRIPMRYGLIVFFSSSILAGAGAVVLLSSQKWLIVPIVALGLLESAVFPYPTLEFHVPSIYQKIAQEPGDFTLLEIPTFNWRQAAKNEVYQDIHQKRILRAYTNRIAPDIADYFALRQTPIVVKSLRILEGAENVAFEPEEQEQDHAVGDATIGFFNLRYVIVHRDQLADNRSVRIDSYLRYVLNAKVVSDDGTDVAYVLPGEPASGDLSLDLSQDSALMYLGRGWQTEPLANINGVRGRFLNRASGEIYLPGAPGSQQLGLLTYSPLQNLSLELQPNSQNRSTLPLNQNWRTYTLPLTLPLPMNVVRIISSNSASRVAVSSIETKGP